MDDFVTSGATVNRIIDAINATHRNDCMTSVNSPRCVAIVHYNRFDGPCRAREFSSLDGQKILNFYTCCEDV